MEARTEAVARNRWSESAVWSLATTKEKNRIGVVLDLSSSNEPLPDMNKTAPFGRAVGWPKVG
jgi:hypothetical protein